MHESELKIPSERVPVLIGKNGQIKKKLQYRTNTRIKISREGDVLVIAMDSFDVFRAIPIIKAIGRGFNPDIALCLLQDQYAFETISLADYTKKSKKRSTTLKARLIGKEGKARKQIEVMTNTNIVVYGKTVGVIGTVEDVYLAKNALIKLLQGAPHGNAYKYIERQLKRRLEERFVHQTS